MNPVTQPVRSHSDVTSVSTVLSLLLVLGSYFAAGCGSSGMSSGTTSPPPPPSPTSVAMVVSSTANSQFSSFNVDVTSISLTNQAGKTVSVLAAPQGSTFSQIQEAEFIHLNGQTAPFLTAMVPQDTYTSATLTYSFAEFTTVQLGTSGGIELVNDATGGPTAASQVASVVLPAPLTIHGNAMTVALDLQAPASVTVPTQGPGQPPYSITPTFTLTAVAPAAQSQVQVKGVDGLVSSISGSNSLSLMVAYGFNNPTYPDGATFTVATNTSTVYQGIGSFSALATGMIANMDLAIQSDGSLLATRIEVDDPAATNVLIGPIGKVNDAFGYILELSRTNEEFNQSNVPGGGSWNYAFDASTAFRLSEQIAVPSNLPFSATFDSSHMIAGQNVAVASGVIVTSGGIQTHATTITLMPQTINGTIAGVSSNGGFTVYSVLLAARDLFPTLAVQPGQTTVLQSPSIVEVYVNSSTQMLNSIAIAQGNVLRFNGLIFNDNGTARMVASQVHDGVAE
jgi:hypothetical protein